MKLHYLLLILCGHFLLRAEQKIIIEQIANHKGAIQIHLENDIDGIESFIVLRPYVDNRIRTISSSEWLTIGKIVLLIPTILLTERLLVRTVFKIIVRYNKNLAKSDRNRFSEVSQRLICELLDSIYDFYYYNSLLIRINGSIRGRIGCVVLASYSYWATKVAKAIPHKIDFAYRRYNACLRTEEIQTLPLYLRQKVANYFCCEAEKLVWYVDKKK